METKEVPIVVVSQDTLKDVLAYLDTKPRGEVNALYMRLVEEANQLTPQMMERIQEANSGNLAGN